MRAAAALALAILAPATAGCIAAVIPLVAGATVVKRHDDIEKRAAMLDKAAEAAATSSVAASMVTGPAASASDSSDMKVVRTTLTSLPAPDGTVPDGTSAIPDIAVAQFRSYALAQADALPASGNRPSAILPGASSLTPVRGQCGALPAAVFVDLDPGRGTFDPTAPGKTGAALVAALAALRDAGVKVVWFSRLGTNFSGAAREALVAASLDPTGQDELMLMSDIEERKQSLRDEVAKRLCPIAIVGDERADFDELYLYLKNPDAALALDAMIGNGWFLASPFLPDASAQGATP